MQYGGKGFHLVFKITEVSTLRESSVGDFEVYEYKVLIGQGQMDTHFADFSESCVCNSIWLGKSLYS